MIYGDEAIIKQRLAIRAAQQNSIDNIVEIHGVEYTFARREFDAGFTMVVPESFEEMPIEVAKQLFLHEGRPKIIISNSDYTVIIAFNSIELPSRIIEDRRVTYRAFMKRSLPTAVFFTQGIYDLPNEMRVAYYDYRYPIINGDMYNFTFISDLQETELLGWFICSIDSMEKWESLARQMIQTIEVSEKGVAENEQ